jgi:hypothetical protein
MLETKQSLPAGYVPVSAYGGCLKNLKDLNDLKDLKDHPLGHARDGREQSTVEGACRGGNPLGFE